MLLSHDSMEISHAPNPHDVIWENVAIPKNQVVLRTFITNVGLTVSSIFWSSLVTSVDDFSSIIGLPQNQQALLSAAIMLMFLLVLPFIFDLLSRNYEGLKLESEIQNSIMTRYFYYQVCNLISFVIQFLSIFMFSLESVVSKFHLISFYESIVGQCLCNRGFQWFEHLGPDNLDLEDSSHSRDYRRSIHPSGLFILHKFSYIKSIFCDSN